MEESRAASFSRNAARGRRQAMNPVALITVALGGALGSLARYIVGIYAGRWFGTAFPWGTLLINVSGSFLIGAFAEAFALRWDSAFATRVFLIVGICGGYTTFSTFSLDVVTLIGRGEFLAAAIYAAVSVVLSIAALYAALHVMRLWLV
jgi:CrcB protein